MSTTTPTPGPGNEPLEGEARVVAADDQELNWRGVAADGRSEEEISERYDALRAMTHFESSD